MRDKIMSEERVYTEQELSKMADALLEEADHVEIPAEPSLPEQKRRPPRKRTLRLSRIPRLLRSV